MTEISLEERCPGNTGFRVCGSLNNWIMDQNKLISNHSLHQDLSLGFCAGEAGAGLGILRPSLTRAVLSKRHHPAFTMQSALLMANHFIAL